jgi:NADH dehydrogenase
MAVIGRNVAVVDLEWLRVSGFPAWLLWIFVHLLYLGQFQNRLLVLTPWTWSYITRNRSALLISERNTNSSSGKVAAARRSRLLVGAESGKYSSEVKEKVES